MSEKEKPDWVGTRENDWEIIKKGYQPHEDGIVGGYQPETSEAGSPPSGGSGGKEPEKSE